MIGAHNHAKTGYIVRMSSFHQQYIKRILSARVYDVSKETRLHAAPLLSERLKNHILLKREDEQSIFSFKCRGAFNRIFQLTQQGSVSGVVAASAGNHAQGVALSAKHLGLAACIVMPRTTPPIKVDAVRALGAEAILVGDDFNAALTHALALAEEKQYAFIHPFDAEDTIAGQGTVGVEICQQHPQSLDAVFIPIGGGGLAAGVSAYMKYLRPEVRIVGVEPVDAACMHAAFAADKCVDLEQVSLFADGVAVKRAGEETFKVCREFVDEIVLVTVDEMSAAIKDIFNDTRTLTEPAGALAVAGMKRYIQDNQITGQTFIGINSGANINFDRLRHVAERAEIGESREVLLAVKIPEEPGSFKAFCEALGARSVTEFNYRYASDSSATVFAGVELTGGDEERKELIQSLEQSGLEVLDMTQNETAKLHVRYMVGGRAKIPNEQFFRFRFPERPGALYGFLSKVSDHCNISLFHYRNHGAAYGRVLVGLQLLETSNADLAQIVNDLGFVTEDESGNDAIAAFLR